MMIVEVVVSLIDYCNVKFGRILEMNILQAIKSSNSMFLTLLINPFHRKAL
jgi:hypothetical protein